ncbi:MAG: PHP domain-containing protein [bacterium]|nr:PHP domain-containing protein [bacterium]
MFIHLHNHFKGSFFDSIIDDRGAFKKVKEDNNPAISITDHGQMNYVVKFAKNAQDFGIKPIIGQEFYFVRDARETIAKKDNFRNHLVLLAKNDVGFQNLVRLNNYSWMNNYFQRTPSSALRGLLDWELLNKYHDGLICLTGCFFGSLPYTVLNGNNNSINTEFHKYKDIFGDDLYLEMGWHNIPEEKISNEGLMKLCKVYNQKGVITQDSHYLNKEDWEVQDVLINTRFGYSSDFHFKSREYHLKTEDEMLKLGFSEEYYLSTNEINEKIELDLLKYYKKRKDLFERVVETGEEGDKFKEDILPASNWISLTTKEALKRTNFVLGYSDNLIKKILDAIPLPDKSIKENIELSQEVMDFSNTYKKLFSIALTLQDFYIDFKVNRNFRLRSKSDEVILDHFPLVRIQDYNGLLLQYDSETLELLGY